MPFGKALKKLGNQIKKEGKKKTNDHDNNVHNIKEMLSNLGINNENKETFDIGMPHPLKPLDKQEPIKYRWIASTSGSGDNNQKKGEQAKLVLKALLETKHSNELSDVTSEFIDHFSKLNPGSVVAYMTTAKKLGINLDGCVATALKDMGKYPVKWNNVSTKELFAKYDVTNPYCSFDNKIEQEEIISENSSSLETPKESIELAAKDKELILLKLAYKISKKELTMSEAFVKIGSFNDNTLATKWSDYNNLTTEEVISKAVDITGDVSCLLID